MTRLKIFCIGFNKTGTSTLKRFFSANHLKVRHGNRWPYYSHVSIGRIAYYGHNVFCDGERSNFARLQKWFPEALFIYNDRNERDWIYSRLAHVSKGALPEEYEKRLIFLDERFGTLTTDVFVCPERSIDYWVSSFRQYRDLALSYFESDDRFLHLNIAGQDDWQSRIASFVCDQTDRKLVAPTMSREEINKSPDVAKEAKLTKRLMAYYDRTWLDSALP